MLNSPRKAPETPQKPPGSTNLLTRKLYMITRIVNIRAKPRDHFFEDLQIFLGDEVKTI